MNNSNLEERSEAYKKLVQRRIEPCRLCKDIHHRTKLRNPRNIDDGKWDCDKHVGPWSRWASSLNAEILLVGQDFGNVKDFSKN